MIKTLDALLLDATTDIEFISNLANTAAYLNSEMKGLSWIGFYLLDEGVLKLGPFVGKVACTKIAIGKGVCGTAFEKKETLIVEDVHTFPGHIACDAGSNSEIVVPFKYGVLDADSYSFSNFSAEDKILLEKVCSLLEQKDKR